MSMPSRKINLLRALEKADVSKDVEVKDGLYSCTPCSFKTNKLPNFINHLSSHERNGGHERMCRWRVHTLNDSFKVSKLAMLRFQPASRSSSTGSLGRSGIGKFSSSKSPVSCTVLIST